MKSVLTIPRNTQTAAPRSRRHQWFDQFPFRIRHVACITKPVAPILFAGDFSPTHAVLPSSLRKHEGITTDWNHSTFFFGQALRYAFMTRSMVSIRFPTRPNLKRSGSRSGQRREPFYHRMRMGGHRTRQYRSKLHQQLLFRVNVVNRQRIFSCSAYSPSTIR